MKEVLVLSWIGELSWLPNVQWGLVLVLCPDWKRVLVWAELFHFKKSRMLVPSVLKLHFCPKQNQSSDGDAFHIVSVSAGSNLLLFIFCCCWQKKDLNEEYGAPIMCNLTWMHLHRIGEEQDQGRT